MEIIFKGIKFILSFAGIIAILPTVLIIPSVVVTGIITLVKKDKKYIIWNLKIWGYSLVALIVVLLIYALTTFIFTSLLGVELPARQ